MMKVKKKIFQITIELFTKLFLLNLYFYFKAFSRTEDFTCFLSVLRQIGNGLLSVVSDIFWVLTAM